MGLVLILGHSTIFRKKHYLNNLMLRFESFEKKNIQELKARLFLRKLVLNINIFSIDLPPK